MIDHSRRFSVLLSLLAVCVPNVTAAEAPRVLIADWEMEQIATEPNLVTPVGCCHDEERLFYEGGSATMAVVAPMQEAGITDFRVTLNLPNEEAEVQDMLSPLVEAFRKAIAILDDGQGERAKRVLEHFSDLGTQLPQSAEGMKGALGAIQKASE